jgi:hypothetical protein
MRIPLVLGVTSTQKLGYCALPPDDAVSSVVAPVFSKDRVTSSVVFLLLMVVPQLTFAPSSYAVVCVLHLIGVVWAGNRTGSVALVLVVALVVGFRSNEPGRLSLLNLVLVLEVDPIGDCTRVESINWHPESSRLWYCCSCW